ncbi:hypothetical protein PG999_010578 [Apiospora kogelbergensis]|uniref:Uncharacterized protein n=1 Tax=Apiospora kogelbergensis TaxID=1337665 RepID=A0AAW0QLN7_9PEZI
MPRRPVMTPIPIEESLGIHCNLQAIIMYIYMNGGIDVSIEVTRVIAHLLVCLGETLNDIEASVHQDARTDATGVGTHAAYVMSLYFDVREVIDDLLV